MRFPNPRIAIGLVLGATLQMSVVSSEAGSATWKSNAASGDWESATNWTPETVPNGPADIATFGTSNQTDLTVTEVAEVDSAIFDAGASAFTITPHDLVISGPGITNNPGIGQTFVNEVFSRARSWSVAG